MTKYRVTFNLPTTDPRNTYVQEGEADFMMGFMCSVIPGGWSVKSIEIVYPDV